MTESLRKLDSKPEVTIFDFPQGSDEWEAIRRGKLTGSEFTNVLGSSDYKKMRLIDDYLEGKAEVPDFGRATKQLEVFEALKAAGKKGMITSDLNASGVKGCEDKGLAEKFIDAGGCTIKDSAAAKHIDLLVSRKLYNDADLGVFTGSFATDRGNEFESSSRIDFQFEKGIDVKEIGFAMLEGLNLVGVSPDGLTEDGGVFETKCPLPQTHLRYLRKNVLPTEYKAQVHGQMAITGTSHAWFQSYCPGLPPLTLKIPRDNYTENLLKCLYQFQGVYLEQLNHYGVGDDVPIKLEALAA